VTPSAVRALPRHCPLCGSPVPEALSPSGRRRRGRPRVFCSERCRLGERRLRSAADPATHREQVAVFAAAVRAAVTARGLSLRELDARLVATYPQLASSVATLSAWQTGTSAPPRTPSGRDRVLALERCLGVPAGDLALLVPGSGAVLPARAPARSADLGARHARLAHLVTTLAGPQQVLPVALAEEVRLGPGHRPVAARITLRVRAAHDGVDRFWYVDGADPRSGPVVVETDGCRRGRRVREPGPVRGARLAASELVLDHRLERGERHELSFLVRYDPAPGPPQPVFRRLVNRPYERLDLSVGFDGDRAPDTVLACRWRHRDGTELDRRDVTVAGCLAYRLVVTDPVPGGYGWRWALPARRDSAA
jgi:hypothetical protein